MVFDLDAIKHIDFKYFDKWLEQRAKQLDKKLLLLASTGLRILAN